ncbi:MAG: ABC transporter ATP-binding protein [Chloroflexi bacterium]|nr:ABC transporter ATP-binding protein [Chloroflexota bacterium]
MALLEVKRVWKHFGGLVAVRDLDLEIEEGEIRGLIGPNGSGKTTLFNVITGIYRPDRGSVVYRGEDITGKPPNVVTRKLIARTFQQVSLFGGFTVMENVRVASHMARRAETGDRDGEQKSIMDALELVGIAQFKDKLASDLPFGHQRALQLAIAFATRPRLLLLDEPLSGMNPKETAEMVHVIRRIREAGVTVWWIEHNVTAIMGGCDKVSVLNFGQKIAEGKPEEVQKDQAVIESYLGTGEKVA